MQKLLSSVVFYLMSLPVLAASEDISQADAPVEMVGMVYVVIFGILFIGSIVGFFIYLYINEKKSKSDK